MRGNLPIRKYWKLQTEKIEQIRARLKAAQDRGWTSIRASILGGAQVVKDSYITRYSQNTLYYQKFNG